MEKENKRITEISYANYEYIRKFEFICEICNMIAFYFNWL